MDYSELRKGDLVAVSGLIERNEFRDSGGEWTWEQRIIADWIEPLGSALAR
jgi:single-stranded DNA-binding protein